LLITACEINFALNWFLKRIKVNRLH